MTELLVCDRKCDRTPTLLSHPQRDSVTEHSKARLRARTRSRGFKRNVTVSRLSSKYPLCDSVTEVLAMILSRARAHAHTRPRDLNFSRSLSLCHRGLLHAEGGQP